MLVPTAIATQLAADSVASRRGAATRRLNLPTPLAARARARTARRPAAARPCVAC
jgi:hypothetical protein